MFNCSKKIKKDYIEMHRQHAVENGFDVKIIYDGFIWYGYLYNLEVSKDTFVKSIVFRNLKTALGTESKNVAVLDFYRNDNIFVKLGNKTFNLKYYTKEFFRKILSNIGVKIY